MDKKQNAARLWLSAAAFTIVFCGIFICIGFWKAQASSNTVSIQDHESRIRTVEETVIRTDERLGNIEEDISDIAEELKDQ